MFQKMNGSPLHGQTMLLPEAKYSVKIPVPCVVGQGGPRDALLLSSIISGFDHPLKLVVKTLWLKTTHTLTAGNREIKLQMKRVFSSTLACIQSIKDFYAS